MGDTTLGSRVFALSDLHVDYKENRKLLDGWPDKKYSNGVLVVAGDVTDNMTLLETTLKGLQLKFRQVFFVPGNHELWMRSDDKSTESIGKFHAILALCARLGVGTSLTRVPLSAGDHVWLVPLFSWYATPEEDPDNSFYVRPSAVCRQRDIWMDNHMCVWPTPTDGQTRADYFADLNRSVTERLRYYYHASGLNWTMGDTTLGSRVFALSDLHVDYKENRKLLDGWPERRNHELWMRSDDKSTDSIGKFHAILALCARLGVGTSLTRVPLSAGDHVWLVPLFSWYATPEEDPDNSFYVRPSAVCRQRDIWMDNHMCVWPTPTDGQTRADYFADLNRSVTERLRYYYHASGLNWTMGDTTLGSRVFALSDLHVDYKENRKLLDGWPEKKYSNDVLVVAGDVTDNMTLLETTLKGLQLKFRQVFFVPGNHELWMRSDDKSTDSIGKFHAILALCARLGVGTSPTRVPLSAGDHVWLVPLFSWYATPEEDPDNSFYVRPSAGEDEARQRDIWMDNHMCVWPTPTDGQTRADYFADLNRSVTERSYDAPVSWLNPTVHVFGHQHRN
ncbi:hypothetical protein NP493_79g07008 [Ridgeia piscesae]|uniref:Calcineurin-like phosphoesterase domain-containing protein n=1 Tax=Ridgeia piscesae TaxID=27915 RepID=A0AAD9P981_RIDPI|nr:hypothetical protein NP493_79g07008 [Ridgeia piscesae]